MFHFLSLYVFISLQNIGRSIPLTLIVQILSHLAFYYSSKMISNKSGISYQFINGKPRKFRKSKFWNRSKCNWSWYLNEVDHFNLHLISNVAIKFIEQECYGAKLSNVLDQNILIWEIKRVYHYYLHFHLYLILIQYWKQVSI